jgi:hypothetical protein
MKDQVQFRARKRPMLGVSDKDVMDIMCRCEERERKARDQLEVIESMLEMEIDSAKKQMKRANIQGEMRNFEYYYGQVTGLGTALCCFRKALDMHEDLLQSQEILFFPGGKCGVTGLSFDRAVTSGFMSLGNVVWEIYLELLNYRLEPIPATVYEAFYERALDKGYPTELYIKNISDKREKTPEDRKILRTAVTCEQIATRGEAWHGEEITERYIRRGVWRK